MSTKGFTLIEIIVVIGILAIILAITLVALNPSRQFAQANNTKRRSDVNALVNAINQYQVNNRGQLPADISTSLQTIDTGNADLCTDLVPDFLAALPVDPLTNSGTAITNCAQAYSTNYTVIRSATDSRITVAAPAAQNGEIITVTR